MSRIDGLTFWGDLFIQLIKVLLNILAQMVNLFLVYVGYFKKNIVIVLLASICISVDRFLHF